MKSLHAVADEENSFFVRDWRNGLMLAITKYKVGIHPDAHSKYSM